LRTLPLEHLLTLSETQTPSRSANAKFAFNLYDVDDDSMIGKGMSGLTNVVTLGGNVPTGGLLGGKDHLGGASMTLSELPPDTPTRRVLQLLTAKKKPAGNLTVTTTWKPFLEKPESEDWDAINELCVDVHNFLLQHFAFLRDVCGDVGGRCGCGGGGGGGGDCDCDCDCDC
jgi:hypothetical protein